MSKYPLCVSILASLVVPGQGIQVCERLTLSDIRITSAPAKLLKTDRIIPNLYHMFDLISIKDHLVHIIGTIYRFQDFPWLLET
jgi:hypothetical protein